MPVTPITLTLEEKISEAVATTAAILGVPIPTLIREAIVAKLDLVKAAPHFQSQFDEYISALTGATKSDVLDLQSPGDDPSTTLLSSHQSSAK